MARYSGPKHKLARREGVNILEKTSPSLDRRINIAPGMHGKKMRRKPSEYGVQLREKQRLKRIYGLLERQFTKYVRMAQKRKGNTEEVLAQLLETRLDNVVYRLGFAKSRNQARQFVSHRHVLVNGKIVNIPSYRVQEEDVITLSSLIFKTPDVLGLLQTEKEVLPYLSRDKGAGTMLRLPTRDEVANPVDYQLVIEYYSR